MHKISLPFTVLSSIYCVLLLLDSLLEIKVISLFNLELTLGTAIIASVYICSDCLVEVYGFAKARLIMWLGFALLGFSTLVLKLSCLVPAIPNWDGNEHFNYLFNMSPRIALACLAAYITGSYVNNYVMSKLKVLLNGKYFKSRALISTICGESVDAVVGTFGIFFGLLPLSQVVLITVSMASVKILIEFLALPVTAKVVDYLKTKEGTEYLDTNEAYRLFSLER